MCPFFSQLVSFSPPLQIEVVNTFKSGASFQGALRRQSSVTSQSQDVANLSSPSRVSLSNALSSPTSLPPAAAGRECESLLPRAPPTPVLGGQGPGHQGHGGQPVMARPRGLRDQSHREGSQLVRRALPVMGWQSFGGPGLAGVRVRDLTTQLRGREG